MTWWNSAHETGNTDSLSRSQWLMWHIALGVFFRARTIFNSRVGNWMETAFQSRNRVQEEHLKQAYEDMEIQMQKVLGICEGI